MLVKCVLYGTNSRQHRMIDEGLRLASLLLAKGTGMVAVHDVYGERTHQFHCCDRVPASDHPGTRQPTLALRAAFMKLRSVEWFTGQDTRRNSSSCYRIGLHTRARVAAGILLLTCTLCRARLRASLWARGSGNRDWMDLDLSKEKQKMHCDTPPFDHPVTFWLRTPTLHSARDNRSRHRAGQRYVVEAAHRVGALSRAAHPDGSDWAQVVGCEVGRGKDRHQIVQDRTPSRPRDPNNSALPGIATAATNGSRRTHRWMRVRPAALT